MTREELFHTVELLRDTAKIHQPNEEILTDVKAKSFIFVMDSVLSALSENKGDLISRQAVDDAIYDYSRSCDVDYAQIMEHIDKIPSAENKGEWKDETPNKDTLPIYTCSECGMSNLWESPFCPSCGADMRGE